MDTESPTGSEDYNAAAVSVSCLDILWSAFSSLSLTRLSMYI